VLFYFQTVAHLHIYILVFTDWLVIAVGMLYSLELTLLLLLRKQVLIDIKIN